MDRARLAAELVVRIAIAETTTDAADTSIHRQNETIAREQQHPVRTSLAELRQRPERAASSRQRSVDHGRQVTMAPEDFDPGAQRAEPVLQIGSGERHGIFEPSVLSWSVESALFVM